MRSCNVSINEFVFQAGKDYSVRCKWVQNQNQNQVLLAKWVCTTKEFDLVEWLSMCLHKIYITTQYKTNSATVQRSKKFKKYVQGGMAIYSSCEMLHNNSAKKK